MSTQTRSRRFFLQWLLCGGGSVVALAACGDSDSSLTALTPPATESQARSLLSEQGAADLQFSFPQGVFSGDPTATGLVVATRALPTHGTPAVIAAVLEVSTDPSFQSPELQVPVLGRAEAGENYRQLPGDYILRHELTGLEPDQIYYFRFIANRFLSPTGQFRTLPADSDDRAVQFLHLSCANEPPYPVAQALADSIDTLQPYLVVFNGDTVYADRFWLGLEPIPDIEFYRSLYRDQRDPNYTGPGFEQLYLKVPFVANWDDHEVIDNYSGQGPAEPAVQIEIDGSERDVTFYQTLGYQAFFEYSCLRSEYEDSFLAVDPLTRVFRRTRVGANLEIFTLDLRQYREPEAGRGGGFVPLLPVLPPGFTPRQILQEFDLPNSLRVPFFGTRGPGFESNLREQERVLLGDGQKQWLFNALQSSPALFKVIITEYIFSENFILPYDRWEGYWQERQEVLAILESVPNVVLLAGDQHAGQISQVNAGSSNPIFEIGTGPTGRSTLARSVIPIGESLGIPNADQLFYDITNYLLADPEFGGEPRDSLRTLKFYEIDTPNYTTVEVTNGAMTVQVRDASGGVLVDPLGRRGEIVIQAQ